MAGKEEFVFTDENPFQSHVEHVLEPGRVPVPSERKLGIPHHVMHRMCTDQVRRVMSDKSLCDKYVALNNLRQGRQVSALLDRVFSFCNEETWTESDRVQHKEAIIDLWLLCAEGDKRLRAVADPYDWLLDAFIEHRAGQRPLTLVDHLVHYELIHFPMTHMMRWPKDLERKFVLDRYSLAQALAALYIAGNC